MGHNDVWNSHPKEHSAGGRTCRVCSNPHGLIRKYGLNICRQCFRERANEIGFTKGLYEVWGEGADWEELQAAVEAYPHERKAPYLHPDVSFRVIIDGWGQKLSKEEQLEFIHKLAFIPFEGTVDLKNAKHRFWLIVADCTENNGMPEGVPYRLYFCREIATSDRSLLTSLSLKERHYLGPTSMDTEMALIMCNQAKVRRGGLVFDPYAGTGSMLVAAAHHGAHVIGGDIDIRVIRDGKTSKDGRNIDIYTNFLQYGLPFPAGLLRMDAHSPPFREGLEEVFSAIMGDPPYGVRAGARKMVAKSVLIRDRATHVPSTAPYTLGEVLRDLLDMAARMLVMGGRLVYFMPCTPETYSEDEIPTHPGLQLISNSEQVLTTRYSRRLIVMEKVKKYNREEAVAHMEACGDPIMAIDNIHEIVYENLRDEEGNIIDTAKLPTKRKFRSKNT